jgi:hypothetical protein
LRARNSWLDKSVIWLRVTIKLSFMAGDVRFVVVFHCG